jgi:putative endonuclease
MKAMFYVYVLHAVRDNGLYIGFSANLRKRLKEHNTGLAFATSHRRPWKLIYYEAYIEEEDASGSGRERYLKSGGRRRLLRTQLRHYFKQHTVQSTA